MSTPRQSNEFSIVDGVVRLDVSTPRWPSAVAILDIEDLPLALDGNGRWSAHRTGSNKSLYAHRTRHVSGGRKRTEHLHRVVLGLPDGRRPVVDHADRDGLNNRRGNIRATDQVGNGANSRHGRGSSRFKGVFMRQYGNGRAVWRAGIMVARKMHWLGTFQTEEAAARAYDSAAREHSGAFALTNFQEAVSL